MTDPVDALAGRFQMGELLGTGGSASVYAAVDVRSGESIAVKVLHPHLSERPAARAAFLAEARRAASLRHPNIVGVISAGVADGADGPVTWIALERAAGLSLSRHVAMHGPLSASDALTVADKVLQALTAAHAREIVHRDVSPANVMVAPPRLQDPACPGAVDPDSVRLLDFGLADAAGRAARGVDDLLSHRATGRTGVMGNVNYMSPEQARGEGIDARGDVYQVGAMLYFALTGRPPFGRETVEETLLAHLDAQPPVPSATDPSISRAVDRVVVRALLKDPSDRFASAEAMRRAVIDLAPAGQVPPDAQRATVPVRADEEVFDPLDVTRVLGSTVAPPRERAALSTAPGLRSRPRTRVGGWFALAAGAVVVAAVVVGVIVSPDPSVTGAEPQPTSPSSAPPPAPADPIEEPAPSPISQIVDVRTVPDLFRFTLAEALRALSDAGIVVGAIVRVDSPLASDTVLESDPVAGRDVSDGEPVSLVVASGFHTVPDVAGLQRDAAASRLQQAGFAPSLGSPGAAQGTVLATTPAAGSVVAVGSSVTVVEAPTAATTPTPQPSTATPTPTPTPSPTVDPQP